MRTRVVYLLTGTFLMLAAPLSRADDRSQALAVIDKAIDAHGGESKLTKARQMVRTAKGVQELFGNKNQFSTEQTTQLPERFRDAIDYEAGGQKARLIFVLNSDKGWQSIDGVPMELPKDRADELREEAYVIWLTTLVPLKDKSISVSPLPEGKVLGQPASVIKVISKGHTDVKLYFDAKTGLLVKLDRAARQAGLTINKEYFFSNHKEFDGVKLPTKYVELISGNKSIDLTISDYKFPNSVPDKLFGKP